MSEKKTQERTVFLTGVTGNIGSRLAATILDKTGDTRLVLLVRAASEEEALRRFDDSLHVAYPRINLRQAHQRIQIVRGDLTSPKLGIADRLLPELRTAVTHVIHAAASTKFHSPLESATGVNYEGTRRVLGLALDLYRKGRLQGFSHVSTAYLCGNCEGLVKEDELPSSPQFSNSYEHSKWLAEKLVRDNMCRLPVAVFRPSIVVGDSQTGRIVTFNVMYTPLRLIWSGVVRQLPAIPATALDVVPVDYVADSIWHILSETEAFSGKTYHLAAGAGNCLSVKEIVDRAVACFNVAFPNRRQSPVRFVPPASAVISDGPNGGNMTRTQKTLTQFAPYMMSAPKFDCSNCIEALKGTDIKLPDIRQYLDRVLYYCLSAIRHKLGREAAWRSVA